MAIGYNGGVNLNLQQAIIKYTRDGHQELSSFLLGLSKDNHIALITDLLTWYFNDKNSSSLREYVTTVLCGYTHESKKLGYNGYKQLAPGKTVHCEVKPANFDTAQWELFKEKKRKTSPAKLDGGGSINDYTFARLEKDIGQNPNFLLSGFVDGRLMYILEVPFVTPTIVARLRAQLIKRFPQGKDVSGAYLRGATFNFSHYCDSAELKVCYVADTDVIEAHAYAFNRQLHKFLLAHAKLGE